MQFTWVAENYYHNSDFQLSHATALLSKYTFLGNENVLDVGCGDGRITALIAGKTNGKVIGIDNSKEMITFAKNTFENSHKNLSFELSRAEKIPFHEQFNLVVSFACLHWVRDQLAFLTSAKKSLKENGQIIITLYPKHPAIWGAIEKTIQETCWSVYFKGYQNPHVSYNMGLYKQLVLEAGLKILLLEEDIPIAKFKTIIEAENFLHSWLPHTNEVPTSLKPALIEDIIARFIKEQNIKKDCDISIPFKRLDIILKK